MPTISKEDYLKAIYKSIVDNGNVASTTYLSNKLAVSKAAVTDMSKKMAKLNLISYIPYKGVELKPKGKEIALKILRRHRLWELFLVETLGVSWDKVHAEAEILEHSTSEFLIDIIDKSLGYPKFDPHGEPIPDKKGKVPKLPPLQKLANCEIGKRYNFIKIKDENSDLINYLSSIGLLLYEEIKIIDKLSFDNSIIIEIDGVKHSLSEKISNKIELTLDGKEFNKWVTL